MYHALARKWRPKNFKELVGQKHITQALTYALDNQAVHHAYLFTGTRGVGKTTIARIFAKSLSCLENGISSNPCGNCEHCREIDAGIFPDLIEVDAASRTKVEDTRQLLANVPYAPVKGRFKIYLIDEVHMFSAGSFNALLKTLEEPPEHIKFVLATTDPQKIPLTVLSRCLQFQLKNMTRAQIESHLSEILTTENREFDAEALSLISEAAQGSMRDALSLLDQAAAYGRGRINTADTAFLLGAVPMVKIREIFACLCDGNAHALREVLASFSEFSPDYSDVLRRILQGLQEMTIVQLGAERFEAEIHQDLALMANRVSVELLQLWYQIATDAWQSLPYHPSAAQALEMTLLRMIALQPLLPNADISRIRVPEEAQKAASPRNLHSIDAQITHQLEPYRADEIAVNTPTDEAVNTVNAVQTVSEKVTDKAVNTVNAVQTVSEKVADEAVNLADTDKRNTAPEAFESQMSEINPEPQNQEIKSEAQVAEVAEINSSLPKIASSLEERQNLFLDCIGDGKKWAKFFSDFLLETFGKNAVAAAFAENFLPVNLFGDTLKFECDEAGSFYSNAENIGNLERALLDAIGHRLKIEIADKAESQTKFSVEMQAEIARREKMQEDFQRNAGVQLIFQTLGCKVQEVLEHLKNSSN
ncbi:MAG: DNA polymerase III subunit gamma/tau [Cardiobacteriaceae bacterium]|nr:DNA polymerase III subunit gamma/tau [Cardiobacteriaceae bacterium]